MRRRRRQLLTLLRLLPLLVWTWSGGLLLLGGTFYHLQARLDIGTWCRGQRAAVGVKGGTLIRSL